MALIYDREARDRLDRLEERIHRLESAAAPTASEIAFSADGEGGFDKTFYFNAAASGVLTVSVSGTADEQCSVALFVDGAAVRSFASSGDLSFTADVYVEKGRVEVRLKADKTVRGAEIKVRGAVETSGTGASLCAANLDGKSFVIERIGTQNKLKVYDGEKYETTLTFEAESSALSIFSDGVLLAFVKKDEGLYVDKIDFYGYPDGQPKLVDEAVSSVGGALGEYGFVLYAVKNGRVRRYNVDGDLKCTSTQLGQLAKSVSASPNVGNCFIVTDFNGSAKLVVD